MQHVIATPFQIETVVAAVEQKGFSKNIILLLWAIVETGRSTDKYLCRGTRINIYINTFLLKTDDLIKIINATKQVPFLNERLMTRH